jgi:hypothetical protein
MSRRFTFEMKEVTGDKRTLEQTALLVHVTRWNECTWQDDKSAHDKMTRSVTRGQDDKIRARDKMTRVHLTRWQDPWQDEKSVYDKMTKSVHVTRWKECIWQDDKIRDKMTRWQEGSGVISKTTHESIVWQYKKVRLTTYKSTRLTMHYKLAQSVGLILQICPPIHMFFLHNTHVPSAQNKWKQEGKGATSEAAARSALSAQYNIRIIFLHNTHVLSAQYNTRIYALSFCTMRMFFLHKTSEDKRGRVLRVELQPGVHFLHNTIYALSFCAMRTFLLHKTKVKTRGEGCYEWDCSQECTFWG